ncbi:MAG: hypothetical protein IKR93_05540 [Firmicutes bacterium]|nr:hypothetical protein [Bacillota bacterium]
MSEDILIDLCSPSLAGLKTASLINVAYENEESVRDDMRSLNERFACKGLRAVPLQYKNGARWSISTGPNSSAGISAGNALPPCSQNAATA